MDHRKIGIALLAGIFISVQAASTPYQGYTLCASGATVHLLDMTGKSVHTWRASGNAACTAYLLPDGSALVPISNTSCTSPQHDGAFPNGRFQKISWDGTMLWDYKICDPSARAGYDIHPMPNGNILVPADARSVAKIFEIKPTGATSGEVAWQFTLPDSLASGSTYMNSVSYNPQLDMILVDLQESVRKLVVIDHRGSGRVAYTFLVGTTGRVHGAAWATKYYLGTNTVLPDADSVAMRFNNLLVVFNGGDQAVEVNMTTNTKVKGIPYAFSDHEGSVQRLPNGNTLVTPGGGRAIVELDDAGRVIGTMNAPGSIQRAYRYGPKYSGLARLGVSVMQKELSQNHGFNLSYTPSRKIGSITKQRPAGGLLELRIASLDGKTVHVSRTQGTKAVFSTKTMAAGAYIVNVRSGLHAFSQRLYID